MIKYQHYNNGKLYSFVSEALIQVNVEWVDAVIYSNGEKKFCRTKEEFDKKFKRVSVPNSHA